MPEYAGALQRLILSRTLWLVVGWPVMGLAWQLFVARPRLRKAKGPDATLRALASARVAGVGGVVLATTATVGHALLLLRLPAGGRVLFEPLARGARFGLFDAGVDLLIDERAAAACGLVCGIALAAAIVLATRPPPARGWKPWAWLQLALAGALLSFLADGFVTAAMGWALAGAAGAWLAGWRDPGAGVAVATRMALGIVAMLAAASLLFWGLGGTWDDAGYASDPQPRLVAVEAGPPGAEATLSMAEPVGARVFVDDGHASLRVPFARASLPSGNHWFRVRTGDGGEDVPVAAVDVAPGAAIAIVPLGPTLSFHAMADELGLRSRAGRSTWRRAIEERVGPGGVAVVAGALLALLGAAAAVSGWVATPAAPGALAAVAAGGTSTAIGPFLLMRLDFLFPSAHQTGVVVASVGAAIVLVAMWRALGYLGTRRWLVFASGAPPGLTLVALGVGGIRPATEVMVAAGVVAAAAHLGALVRGHEPVEPARAPAEALLVSVPARLGELLASMERWVVGSTVAAAGTGAVVTAWVVAKVDEHLVSAPGDRVANGVERAALAVEPLVGASIGRVAWALLGIAALAVLLHAVWPVG